MTVKVKIEPQDKTPLQKREFQLHPRHIAQLEAFAKSLNSDVNYVLGQIIEQVGGGPAKRTGSAKPKSSAAVA